MLAPRAAGLVVLLCGLAGLGCGEGGGSADTAISVVATTTQAADLARNVGGARVDVRSMLRPNADPHDYEPRPSEVAALSDAAVVFKSGGGLDDWLDELIDAAGADARVVTLAEGVRPLMVGGEPDPHWWQDPRNAVAATGAIRGALTEADPGGRATYARNARRYVERLERLDRQIAACVGRVPRVKRRIVSTHDALGYFARRYGIEVVGAVLPSLSTKAQPSAKDVAELVDQIEREGVEAVFGETDVNTKLERAIAREAGAVMGEPLFTDSLGPRGSGGATYLSAMRANAGRLAFGMSGRQVSCPPWDG
jgi:zinc/manganese transport system substrate-binding protein